jgi:hypothetical protein
VCLAQTKRTTPPTEFQLSRSGQAEFVICDYTIEEMFGDFKGHGFNLEDSHLCHFLRLSRLTLAVVLLYVWLVASGSRIIKNGQRSLVDRVDRRDFSIFRIGHNMIERLLTNSQPLMVVLVPYF